MRVKDCQKLQKVLYNRTRAMWFSHKYSKLFTFTQRVGFDGIVDHVDLTHIIKSKVEPATTRIKRLLELTISYSFSLYYMNGKDMILSDSLSRHKIDNSNPHEIIHISFNMCQILDDNYYSEKIFNINKITG